MFWKSFDMLAIDQRKGNKMFPRFTFLVWS